MASVDFDRNKHSIEDLTQTATHELIDQGRSQAADEMLGRVSTATSLDAAIRVIEEYVEVVHVVSFDDESAPLNPPYADVRGLVGSLGSALEGHAGRFESFVQHGVQVEGWLKGELLYFLDEQEAGGRIAGFDREVRAAGTKRIDLKVDFLDGITCWIELKHWFIGTQKGLAYNAQFYFVDPTSVGIISDVQKLLTTSGGERYMLILATPRPAVDDWDLGIARFNSRFTPFHLRSLTSPSDSSEFFFLGLLTVSQHPNPS